MIKDAVSSSSSIPYTSKEGYETLHQQCVSLLTTQHPISHAMRVPQISYFACNLRVNLGKNGKGWTIKGLIYAVRGSPHIAYTCSEGHGPLHQKWMSLLAA